MPTPPTPVLSATSTTGRTVTLTWPLPPGLGPGPETMHIERSLDGVAWTEIAWIGVYAPYQDRGLLSETGYHHRLRVEHPTDGFGAYSNVTVTTTLGPTEGIVQYGFAIGGTGSFGRMQTRLEDGTGTGFPATLEVFGVCQLWQVANPVQTQPGGPGTTIYATAQLLLTYQANAATVSVASAAVLSTQQTAFVGPSGQPQTQYTNVNNAIDLWGRLGSADTLTGTHAPDGFLTLRVNGSVVLDLPNLALGTLATPGWSQVRLHPAGTLTSRTPDGSGIDQNGGLSHFYVGTTDAPSAHDVFDYTFATMTDDQLYGASGAWLRFRGSSGSSAYVPTLWDGRLSDSSATTGIAVGWMTLKSALTVPPLPPPEPPPPEPPEPGPDVAPSYHLEARDIRRLRRAPHVNNEHLRVFYRRFELDLERGQALASGQGSEPYVLLRISRDGGQTWGEEVRMRAPDLGEYQGRVMARRLGHGRDVVFEVVVSDPVSWSLVGAWLDLEPGTH